MNQKNFGIATGRAVSIAFFPMSGGELARLKVAVRRDYIPKGAKEAPVDYLEMTGFIRSEDGNRGVFGFIQTGDLLSLQYTLQSSVSEKDGERQYYQNCVLEHVEFLEPRSVREMRQKEKKAEKKAGK